MTTQGDDGPAETLKRAVSACLRAIAERDDVTVAFGGEPPGFAGNRVQLPAPSRLPSASEVSRLRGAADAVALRLRHHDSSLHASRLPTGEAPPPSARGAVELWRAWVEGKIGRDIGKLGAVI
ncbi:MAG: hypothetical protein HKM95_10400, partial [Inquilinus sp.]|nr:hypothetical protein [Inquilinus sp.]